MDKRGGGGYLMFPSKVLCLTVPKSSVEDPAVVCFRKFLVAKKFMDKKKGVGEYQEFPSKGFCLTVPKNLLGEPFYAVFQKFFGSQKTYG